MPDQQRSFQEDAFLQVDRIERALGELKEQLRSADEFLLLAHARVHDLIKANGPGVPHISVHNGMPQSIGITAQWNEGQFMIRVTHRGEEAAGLLPPGQDMTIEVSE